MGSDGVVQRAGRSPRVRGWTIRPTTINDRWGFVGAGWSGNILLQAAYVVVGSACFGFEAMGGKETVAWESLLTIIDEMIARAG
jgi:hypothetical protein